MGRRGQKKSRPFSETLPAPLSGPSPQTLFMPRRQRHRLLNAQRTLRQDKVLLNCIQGDPTVEQPTMTAQRTLDLQPEIPSIAAEDRNALEYLGRWRRLLGHLIDMTIFASASTLAGLMATDMLEFLVIPMYAAYLWFFFWKRHGHMGHLVVGARIVDHRTGDSINPIQSIARAGISLGDLLLLPWLINIVLVLARKDRRHLYDLATCTAVVVRSDLQIEAEPGPV